MEPDSDSDLDMMRKPMDWPRWPLLPLKRYNKEKRDTDFGFLVATSNIVNATKPDAKVYTGSIYRLTPDTPLSTLQSHDYGTLERVRADGWMVD